MRQCDSLEKFPNNLEEQAAKGPETRDQSFQIPQKHGLDFIQQPYDPGAMFRLLMWKTEVKGGVIPVMCVDLTCAVPDCALSCA